SYLHCESTTRVKKRERQSYSVEEKAAVVRFVLASNNTKAAVHFSIDKSLVSRWVRNLKTQLDDLKNCKSRRVGTSRKEFFHAEEEQLSLGFKIEMSKIVAETAGDTDDVTKKLIASNFKASSHWLKRFLCRHNLTLRRKAKISQ
ncbi:13009_t:CDS:2, partial [Ambispora gerdemannii]